MMRVDLFDFDSRPKDRHEARVPRDTRGARSGRRRTSRSLVYDLPRRLRPADVLVFNDTRHPALMRQARAARIGAPRKAEGHGTGAR